MEVKSCFFGELNTTELYELLQIRTKVFVVEQKCAYQELDGKDYESLHVFFRENGKIIAYLRAFKKDENTVQIGRVLTVYRGRGLGSCLIKEGISQVRQRLAPKQIFIEAQCYAAGFYEKEGFEICTDEFLEDGIPHVGMMLKLQ